MKTAAILAGALLGVVALSAQSSPPQFEVASIKANTSEGPPNYWQISGRPGWTIEERYGVIANSPVDLAPGSTALSDMMRHCLQTDSS